MSLPEHWGRPVNTVVPARAETFDEILASAEAEIPDPEPMSPIVAIVGMALVAGAGVLVVGLILFSPVLIALARLL